MSQVLAGFTVESTDDEIKSMPLKSPLRIKFEKEINIVDALGKISVLSLGDKNDLNDIVKQVEILHMINLYSIRLN